MRPELVSELHFLFNYVCDRKPPFFRLSVSDARTNMLAPFHFANTFVFFKIQLISIHQLLKRTPKITSSLHKKYKTKASVLPFDLAQYDCKQLIQLAGQPWFFTELAFQESLLFIFLTIFSFSSKTFGMSIVLSKIDSSCCLCVLVSPLVYWRETKKKRKTPDT